MQLVVFPLGSLLKLEQVSPLLQYNQEELGRERLRLSTLSHIRYVEWRMYAGSSDSGKQS